MSSRPKYISLLEEAWQQHLAPREDNAPTVISTFAGAGGSSLGYSMAGFKELLAVEWDDNAVATFGLNFPDVPIYHGDISKLSVEDCMKQAGLSGPGELDVLDGSPPCQGFSTAGKRVMDDPRNSLFKEYVRLLRGLQPKVFVMENVSGMVKGKMKLIFAEILRELKASGYDVSARLLNAMYFNVPQSRERMIFIGVRRDFGIKPSHPRAERAPYTVRDALQECPEGDSDGMFTDKRLAMARIIPEGKSYAHATDSNRQFNLQRLSWKRPSFAILKSVGHPKSSYGGGLIHPDLNRHMTIFELKRLNSMPDEYQMIGNFQEKWMRVGNSVPPLFMRAIATHIRENILEAVKPDA